MLERYFLYDCEHGVKTTSNSTIFFTTGETWSILFFRCAARCSTLESFQPAPFQVKALMEPCVFLYILIRFRIHFALFYCVFDLDELLLEYFSQNSHCNIYLIYCKIYSFFCILHPVHCYCIFELFHFNIFNFFNSCHEFSKERQYMMKQYSNLTISSCNSKSYY